jgi:hypothetical protein
MNRSRLSSNRESDRNEVAGDRLDNVAWDQLVDGYGYCGAAATDGRLHCNRSAQRFDRILGSDLLHEVERYAHHDDRDNDHEARDVACRR